MRKKLLILILLIGIAFMLIGCSMMQPNENADVIDHLDDIQDVLPYILERGGEASYVHISD
jgi:hypothetical protein